MSAPYAVIERPDCNVVFRHDGRVEIVDGATVAAKVLAAGQAAATPDGWRSTPVELSPRELELFHAWLRQNYQRRSQGFYGDRRRGYEVELDDGVVGVSAGRGRAAFKAYYRPKAGR